jgi:outer membrane receptor protein involved in Fe transport
MHSSRLLLIIAALPVVAHAQQDDPAPPTVTVTAQKEAVIKKIDKTVYDVANQPKAANGSAQDVLQATPELSVSADGKISVKGNPQVTVLVNGKPTAITSGSSEETALALQTMSGADIASVEVITNPSAAYNANGGAIVNIVLKRNRKPGAHAQLRSSASNQGLWNTGADGDITHDALSVHGSVALRHDGTQKIRDSAVEWNNPLSGHSGPRGQKRQTSEVFVHRVVESAALGAHYALSDTDSLSLSAQRNTRRSRPLFDVLNEGDATYHRISNGPNQQSDNSASLSYSRQDSGTVLKAMLQHSDTLGLVDKSYRDVFIAPALATDYSRATTRSARRLTQATLDWSRASERGQWGAGVDLQDKVDDLSNYQAAIDPATGAETPDLNTTNAYKVKTTLAAAYLTDLIRHEKWEALLGARAESMALRVGPAAQTEHWRAINPSLHLRYAYSDKTDLTFSYRRSLQAPSALDLNPYTTYIDAQNLSRGNPHLQPQRLTSWEIGVNAEASQQLSSSLSAFYRSSQDTVVDARSFADSMLITSRQNGGRAQSTGITGSLDWKPDGQLKLGADGGVYYVMLDTPDLSTMVRQNDVSAYVNVRAAYADLSLDAHMQSAGITPLGRYGATSSVNLVWKHAIDKTLSLTVNANDIFDGSRRTYSTDASTFRQRGFDHFVARRIYVGFVKKY